jgi:KipI family sensor histidine kinase inhibitor
MTDNRASMWRIDPAGDRALLVRVAEAIDPTVLGIVLALERALHNRPVPGLRGTVPAYASLLCYVDPPDIEAVTAVVRELEGSLEPVAISGDAVTVPTVYDGEDLPHVVEATGLSNVDIIERHAAREYLVYCVGFAPGFTYCGVLAEQLVVPRKASPRQRVAPGSVAIAGVQTGIYAVSSPGGWNIIGHTTMRLFDPNADPPARFRTGDRIRFTPA